LRVKISLTPKEGKYLTFMYRKQVEEDKSASTTILAKSFKVNPATATETLQRLAKKKLVEYTRYYNTICRTYGHPDTCPCSKEIFQDSTCMGR